jgi:hypothetical protein
MSEVEQPPEQFGAWTAVGHESFAVRSRASDSQRRSVDVNHDAPATAVGETHIGADPQTVFSVVAEIDRWPSWNPAVTSAKLEGPAVPGTVFRWKSGFGTIVSTLEVVDPPREIAWTGTVMGIKAIHVFRFEPKDGGGTLAHSEESWDGVLPGLFKRFSRRMLDRTITGALARLRAEAERRATSS